MIAYGDRTICSRGQSEYEAPIDKMLQEYNSPPVLLSSMIGMLGRP